MIRLEFLPILFPTLGHQRHVIRLNGCFLTSLTTHLEQAVGISVVSLLGFLSHVSPLLTPLAQRSGRSRRRRFPPGEALRSLRGEWVEWRDREARTGRSERSV